MHILLLISKNCKFGAQRIFLDQARVLDQMGHKVIVASRGESGFVADSVRAMGLEYHGIPMKGLKDIFFLLKLARKYNIHVRAKQNEA